MVGRGGLYPSADRRQGGDATRTYVPRNLLRLSTVWDVASFDGLRVGASVRWQDDSAREQSLVLANGLPVVTTQPAYAIVGAMAGIASATAGMPRSSGQPHGREVHPEPVLGAEGTTPAPRTACPCRWIPVLMPRVLMHRAFHVAARTGRGADRRLLVAHASAAFLALVAPFARPDRVATGTLLSFVAWCLAGLYAFGTRSTWRAWWVPGRWAPPCWEPVSGVSAAGMRP
jgi:hypothetical protein